MERRREKEWENCIKLTTKSQLPNIPDELVLDILPRLPVKSLFRFRCVCKAWRSSISNPEFTLRNPRRTFILDSRHDKESVYFQSIDDDGSIEKLDKPWNNESIRCRVHLLGSCNGLLLIRRFDCIYLWNPSTRDCNKVFYYPGYIPVLALSCLCYDSSINDYKVLIGYENYGTSVIQVRSFKSKIWKNVPFTYCIPAHNYGPVINGYQHWLTIKINSRWNCFPYQVIIYFDQEKEEFREIPTPALEYGFNSRILGLGELGGCLAMARWDNRDIAVLGMKKYGVEESWTTLFKFSTYIDFFTYYWVPLFITKNGEVLGMSGSDKIMICNCEDKLGRTTTKMDHYITSAVMHVESLISPRTALQID